MGSFVLMRGTTSTADTAVSSANPLPVTQAQPPFGNSIGQAVDSIPASGSKTVVATTSASGDYKILPAAGGVGWWLINGSARKLLVEIDSDGSGYDTGGIVVPASTVLPVIHQSVFAVRVTDLSGSGTGENEVGLIVFEGAA